MRLFSKKSATITPPENFIPQQLIEMLTDDISVFGTKSEVKKLKYFVQIPELNNVITYKARMFSKMQLDLISRQTGQVAALTNPIQKLLKSPNFHQSQKEFLTQTKLYREIFGEEFIYFLLPFGMNVAKQMNTLNPVLLTFEDKSSTPKFLRTQDEELKYSYKYKNKSFDLDQKDVLHIKNATVTANLEQNTNSDNVGRGSKIDSLIPNLENIEAAYESRGVLLRRRGPSGVLTNDNAKDTTGAILPFDKKDKEALQKDFARYGLLKKQWQVILTNLSLKWQQIGSNPKELMLFEEIEADFMRICDAYGLDYMLFATEKGATFTNKKEAQRQSYENTIIPEAQEWVDALNSYFGTDGTSTVIRGSFDYLSVFDENLKERGQSITLITNGLSKAYTDGAISLQQYQAELKKYGL